MPTASVIPDSAPCRVARVYDHQGNENGHRDYHARFWHHCGAGQARSLAQGGRRSGEAGRHACEVETDKATSELESIAEGVLLKQVVPDGEDVQQGTVIAYVGAAGEVAPPKPAELRGVAVIGQARRAPAHPAASGTPAPAARARCCRDAQSPARQAGPTARQADCASRP